MKNFIVRSLSVIVLSIVGLCFASFSSGAQGGQWKYIGSYTCNYDAYGPNSYQAKIVAEIYYKPYNGGMVTYGIKDNSGNFIEVNVGISQMRTGGWVSFHNFQRSKDDIGTASIKISDLPDQYWPREE